MMGPVLRNLDKKGCVNKGIIMRPKQNLLLQNKGGGKILRRQDSLYLACSSLASYNNVALISLVNYLVILWSQICILFCQ